MVGRSSPTAGAAQSIVMCSDVPCTCMYVILLFLSVTTFSRVQAFHCSCKSWLGTAYTVTVMKA